MPCTCKNFQMLLFCLMVDRMSEVSDFQCCVRRERDGSHLLSFDFLYLHWFLDYCSI